MVAEKGQQQLIFYYRCGVITPHN